MQCTNKMSAAEFLGMFPGIEWAGLLLLVLIALTAIRKFRSAPVTDPVQLHANRGIGGLILFAVFLSIPVVWLVGVLEVPYLFGHICQFLVAHHM